MEPKQVLLIRFRVVQGVIAMKGTLHFLEPQLHQIQLGVMSITPDFKKWVVLLLNKERSFLYISIFTIESFYLIKSKLYSCDYHDPK